MIVLIYLTFSTNEIQVFKNYCTATMPDWHLANGVVSKRLKP